MDEIAKVEDNEKVDDPVGGLSGAGNPALWKRADCLQDHAAVPASRPLQDRLEHPRLVGFQRPGAPLRPGEAPASLALEAPGGRCSRARSHNRFEGLIRSSGWKSRLQMPGLRLLGAGGRGTRTRAPTRLPREPALGRSSGSPIWPRPNGDPQTGLGEQSGTNPAPAPRNFSVARAQGESRGRRISSSRAARTLRHPLASHCLSALQAPGSGYGVSLGQGRKDPPGLGPERPVICKRRSRCILDAAPWLY
ncbi:translation initiation factor IF-2-like [Rhinolophus ferrumequinum]|uniref:translation initiation factor IF-2-like n=1 Tax=Rhinolophus ferrumequinum TaxID=59479 RepID=UPI00140F8CD9|nr:translation initiation factor IF-2-like [Rhinolophus ferrumequinum]